MNKGDFWPLKTPDQKHTGQSTTELGNLALEYGMEDFGASGLNEL